MSTELTAADNVIPSMSAVAIDKVREFENMALRLPQADLGTRHLIHAGMYARTIMIPAGVSLTGALITIPTVLVISGHVIINTGDGLMELSGYHILPASANRKQAFLTKSDTYLTMIFATSAKTVSDAECEFTDESDKLMSRHGENKIVITGE